MEILGDLSPEKQDKRMVWNNHIGWKKSQKSNVLDGRIVLGGKFLDSVEYL